MTIFAHWSIRYKLLGLLLLLGLATFAVTGTIAYLKYLKALKDDVTKQLSGLNRTKAFQIEAYYRTLHNHAESLSDDRMFVDAMRDFRKAYDKMNSKPLPPQVVEEVHKDYYENFYPLMQRLNIARGRPEDYMPTAGAMMLQDLYIVKNPYPRDHRDELADAGDGSQYSKVHAKYHKAMRSIIQKFGYYDLYLIDFDTQRILYDVSKYRDFGTSLAVGPYRDSNLAKVVKQCLASKDPDDVFFSDFEPYEPSHGEPTQYVASPIWDGNRPIGIFALQLSTAAIDEVMSNKRNWKREGLGETGESVLIGSDNRLRSNPRPYLEDPEASLASLKWESVPDPTLDKIRAYRSMILQLPMNYDFAHKALDGKEGTVIQPNFPPGGASLVSYAPLHIEGLHWAIVSSMYLSEALKPISEMRRLFSWYGAGLFALTVLAALFVTRRILRPVNELVGAARKVSAGDLSAHVDWQSNDELGLLSNTFNSMTQSIREKTELIEEKNRENERLLLNILPPEIATRLKHGEHEIADSFADITVLSAISSASLRCPAIHLPRRSSICSTGSSVSSTGQPKSWASKKSKPSATATWLSAECRGHAPITRTGWRA